MLLCGNLSRQEVLALWQGLIFICLISLAWVSHEIYMYRFYILPFWVKHAGEMLKLSEMKIGIFKILWLCYLLVYKK